MNKKILIIEDEQDLRDVYGLILDRAGYDVDYAVNGQEGLTKLDDVQPDLVLLDVFMPVMDGKTFLQSIDLKNYPDTQVIVCSNSSDLVLKEDMIKLGALQFVTKANLSPGDLTELVAQYV